MALVISVDYTVMIDDGIQESNPPDGPRATVKFKCLWDQRYQMVRDLVGTWVVSGSSVVRTPPYRYPESPNLICTSIDLIEPFGKPYIPAGFALPWIAKKYAVITAGFTVPTWTPDGPSAYSTIQFGASGEFLTLPETTYRFSDGTPTGTPIGLLVPQMEISVTRHRMPTVPVSQMFGLQGKINNAAYSISGYSFAAGTLLFMPGASTIEADTAGTLSYACEYKFIARTFNWNYYLHPNRTTGFAEVTDGSGNKPYSAGDFSTLP